LVIQPETRYATSGELKVAYQVLGDGPTDLIYVPGFVSHLDLQWTDPDWARALTRLASFSRLIIFDKRGTGLSDPTPTVPTLEERVDDMRAVLDAVGSERADLFGFSEGAAMSAMFAATYPDRVRSIVLFGPVAWMPDIDPVAWQAAERSLERISRVVDNWGQGELLTFMCPSLPNTVLARRLTGVLERAAASPAMARALVDAIPLLDVSHILAAVTQPTLVLQRADDVVVPAQLVREFFEILRHPTARLVELPGSDHWWWVGGADRVLDEIEEFLTGSRSVAPTERTLSTVMFTDIVDSTMRAAQIGDAGWRALLERHDTMIRNHLSRYRGQPIKTMGDGFLATFDGPARALACARTIVRDAEDLGLRLRAGLHTGECEVMGEDVGGMAVNIGARVSALAQPGEILVSQTVKDLVVGSGLRFVDRGVHQLKGVPGEWALFALATADDAGPDSPDLTADDSPAWQRALAATAQRTPRLTSRLVARSRRVPRRRRQTTDAVPHR
jgi:pimeloyl-ACP methyl ester carboxylesterase/class 3 adenylate cyclase